MGNSRTSIQSVIVPLGKIILAGLFLYSGIVKVIDPYNFQLSVASFQLVPKSLIPFVVGTIPWAEIIAGILLFPKRTTGGATTTITALCLGFALFYAYAWNMGIQPKCGCFGNNPLLEASPPQGVLRALAIAALSGLLLADTYKNYQGPR